MKILEIALKEYGTKEITGKSHNKKILEYFSEIGHAWVRDDETAWCAAFVNWVLKKAGTEGTGRLNARSFLKWGQKLEQPYLGCLVVLWRISKKSPYGHVGFYINSDDDWVWILGGNQNNEVKISKYPKSRILEFRG